MKKIEFTTSLLTFYLKGSIEGNEHFINFTVPNRILGLIPSGIRTDNLATNQIASTATNYRLELKKFLLGVFVFMMGMEFLLSNIIISLVLFAIGISIFIEGFECNLVVFTTSGQSLVINFLIFEKGKASEASQEINTLISRRIDDTNVRVQTDKVVDNANLNADRIVESIISKKD